MGREFYQRTKDSGDFLILEKSSGLSDLVSRKQLEKMIRSNGCELEFVFVASQPKFSLTVG